MPSNRRQFLTSTAATVLGAPLGRAVTGQRKGPAGRLDTALFFDVEDIFSPPELGNDDSIKTMRRGAQDYEYLWLLSEKSGARQQADQIVDSVVNDFVRVGADRASLGSPGHWKHNSEEWERARIRLGDMIEKLSK